MQGKLENRVLVDGTVLASWSGWIGLMWNSS